MIMFKLLLLLIVKSQFPWTYPGSTVYWYKSRKLNGNTENKTTIHIMVSKTGKKKITLFNCTLVIIIYNVSKVSLNILFDSNCLHSFNLFRTLRTHSGLTASSVLIHSEIAIMLSLLGCRSVACSLYKALIKIVSNTFQWVHLLGHVCFMNTSIACNYTFHINFVLPTQGLKSYTDLNRCHSRMTVHYVHGEYSHYTLRPSNTWKSNRLQD